VRSAKNIGFRRDVLTKALPLVLWLLAGCGSRVDVCDRYIERYSACFSKMGPEAAAAMKDKLARQRESFRALARTAEGRAQLVKQCTASLEAIRPTCP
jgi:hypothetical protein